MLKTQCTPEVLGHTVKRALWLGIMHDCYTPLATLDGDQHLYITCCARAVFVLIRSVCGDADLSNSGEQAEHGQN